MKVAIVFLLIGVVLLSGCSQNSSKQKPENATILASLCAGGHGEYTAYSLDSPLGNFSASEIFKTVESRCNVFSACSLEAKKGKYTLYVSNVDKTKEHEIFDKSDFKAYISLQPKERDNKTILFMPENSHEVKLIDNTTVILDNKTLKKGDTFDLDGYTAKFYTVEDNAVIFQVLVLTVDDIKGVIDDPGLTNYRKDQNDFGQFSILVQISNSSSEKIYKLLQKTAFLIAADQSGQTTNLNSRIYYYANNNLMASLPLPVEAKTTPGLDVLSIGGVFAQPDVAYSHFKWLSEGFRMQNYPDIKITNNQSFSCSD